MNIWNNRKWKPMLLKEINKPFNDKNYLYEIKFDGIRTIMYVSNNEFSIISRNGINMPNTFPELKSIQKMFKNKTIIDGEIILMDNGKPSFSSLMTRYRLKNKNRIKEESINNKVTFIAFDILYDNKDLTDLKLIDRKKLLNKYKDTDVFVKSKIYDDGIKLFNNIKKLGLEGIIAKLKNSKYEINTRSFNWIKIKNNKEEFFYIGGYNIKKNGISLLLCDNKYNYVGNVSLTKNLDLYNKVINCKIINKSPFINYENNNSIYIKPNITCKVKYLEITKNNHLRQPVIVRSNYETKEI